MARGGTDTAEWKVVPIAPGGVPVFSSSDHEKVHVGRPSVLAFPGGRIVVSLDQYGPGVRHLSGVKGTLAHFGHWVQGKLFVSNDHGKTWTHKIDYPFSNAHLFRDGNNVCALGHRGSVQIMKSSDGGDTWSRPADLTSRDADGDAFTLSPANVLVSAGHVYVPMMRATDLKQKGDLSSSLSLVLMQAPQGSDLTSRKSWSSSAPLGPFRDVVDHENLNDFGVLFFDVPDPGRGVSIGHRRWANRIGWASPHAVRITDPDHCWFDPSGHALHIVARANCHRSNYAIFAKMVENSPGTYALQFEKTPAGKTQVFLPFPGGHLDFDLLYDEASSLYWLLSNQAVDSMRRVDRLPPQRTGLPCQELHRMQLSFSRNLVDWCFAACVDMGTEWSDSRHHGAMAVQGDNLCIVLCSGDPDGRSAHSTNRITFHEVPSFRDLAY